MNITNSSCLPLSQSIVDDRIYNDSKERPVGVATKINRVTNTVEISKNIPMMTPEDKMELNRLFNRCFAHAKEYIKSKG